MIAPEQSVLERKHGLEMDGKKVQFLSCWGALVSGIRLFDDCARIEFFWIESMGWKWMEKHTTKSNFCLVGGTLRIARAKRGRCIALLKLMESNF